MIENSLAQLTDALNRVSTTLEKLLAANGACCASATAQTESIVVGYETLSTTPEPSAPKRRKKAKPAPELEPEVKKIPVVEDDLEADNNQPDFLTSSGGPVTRDGMRTKSFELLNTHGPAAVKECLNKLSIAKVSECPEEKIQELYALISSRL